MHIQPDVYVVRLSALPGICRSVPGRPVITARQHLLRIQCVTVPQLSLNWLQQHLLHQALLQLRACVRLNAIELCCVWLQCNVGSHQRASS